MTDRSSFPILFALWLMVFSASSQVLIIAPILPQIGAALDIPETLQGTLVSAYAVMLGFFALIIGPISDKVGRRSILLLGTGAMTCALLLHAVADDYASLLSVRAVAGACGGMLSGAAVSYVGDYFPYERRGWANGWVMSGVAFGQIIGIPLGTVLSASYGFRLPFLMFAVTMGMAFVLIWRKVPQPPVRRRPGRLTVSGALHDYRTLLRRPEVVAASGVYLLMFLSVSLYVVYLPTWLSQTLAVDGRGIASLFLVGGIASVITGPQAGRLSDRFGRKPLIIFSCIGLCAMMMATTFVFTELWIVYASFFLVMVLIAMRMSPLQALLSELVPGERRGSMMSLAISIGQIGIGIGGGLAGVAFTRYGYASNTIVAAVSVALMALIVWNFLPEPSGEAREEVAPEAINVAEA